VYIDVHSHTNCDRTVTVRSYHSNEQVEDTHHLHSYGIHPWHVTSLAEQLRRVEQTIKLPNCIALGEMGLDTLSSTAYSLQEKAFVAQLEIANHVGKPLIVHNVRSTQRIVQLLQRNLSRVPVVFHGFNLKKEIAADLCKRGYFLSFGAAILNVNSTAYASLQGTSPHHVLLETDNSPIKIQEVYIAAAAALQISDLELQARMMQNFISIFGTII
jgi:TatD DNase family protein